MDSTALTPKARKAHKGNQIESRDKCKRNGCRPWNSTPFRPAANKKHSVSSVNKASGALLQIRLRASVFIAMLVGLHGLVDERAQRRAPLDGFVIVEPQLRHGAGEHALTQFMA